MSSQARDFSSPLADNLNAELERTGMSAAYVARRLEISEKQIGRWRRGQQPRYESVVQLAEVFDRDPAWFFTDHDRAVA